MKTQLSLGDAFEERESLTQASQVFCVYLDGRGHLSVMHIEPVPESLHFAPTRRDQTPQWLMRAVLVSKRRIATLKMHGVKGWHRTQQEAESHLTEIGRAHV